MRRSTMIVCGAAMLLAACAPESSTPPTPGCLAPLGATCTSGPAMTQTVCTGQGGTWGVCSGERLVGTCVTGAGEVVSYYSPWTATSAQSVCAGTWVPAPPPPPPPPPPVEGSVTVSCTLTLSTLYGCMELIGPASAVAGLEAECVPPYGSYSDAACDTSRMVAGHCEIADDPAFPGAEERGYYATATFTLADAQADCTDPNGTAGVWVY